MTKKITGLISPLLPLALLLVLSGLAENRNETFLDFLQDKLDWYNHAHYPEKAYLVTDRFAYRPGEDIWFQGFVSSPTGIRHDSASEDLFVKLINMKGEEIISRRYPLLENQVSGRFLMPRNSIPGKYYLVAYTGWMKNLSPKNIFKKEILIGKFFDKRFQADVLYDKNFYYPNDSMHATLRLIDPSGKPVGETEFVYTIGSFNKSLLKGYGRTTSRGIFRLSCLVPESEDILTLTIELKSRKLPGDYTIILPSASTVHKVVFHSEDGNLVAGMSNMIAFRSETRYGLPISISGSIVDRQGHIYQSARTNNKGTGTFSYIPGLDSCFLRIDKPIGIKELYPLPVATAEGVVLHLEGMKSDSAGFTLNSSAGYHDSMFYWIAALNRNVVWKGISSGKQEFMKIPVSGLGHGILQVNVFNSLHEMIAQRLLHIQGQEQLHVKTDRQLYQSRQRVVITIDYLGESNKVNFAMAVSLRQLSYSPLNTGFDQVLNCYPYDTLGKLAGMNVHVNDNELIASGYSEFNWNKVLNPGGSAELYARLSGLNGVVMDKKENPAQHAKVRVTHLPNFRFYETQSDENGKFKVSFGSDVIDFNYLKVDAYDALGKVNLHASVDQDFSKKLREEIIREADNMDRQKLFNTAFYGDPDVIYSLRYSSRKYMKSENEPDHRYDPKRYADYANALDIIQDMRPFMVKNNMVVFTDSMPGAPNAYVQEGAIIVINGSIKGTHADILKTLIPSDITNINISQSLSDVHRYTPVNFQGVIELTTIQGMYRYRQPALQMGMDILNTGREFYSPDYSIENPTNNDNRRTLYWNPRISISQGMPSLITFYTSDVHGVYYGKIEGMDSEGRAVQTEFTITVE